jgi:hypothetical protein
MPRHRPARRPETLNKGQEEASPRPADPVRLSRWLSILL